MDLSIFDSYVRKIFDFSAPYENSLNGIQVQCSGNIQKLYFAVDADLKTIVKMQEEKNSLLIVHHGLFWGHETPITGALYEKIRRLISQNIGLYALHLPLDIHPIFGNNAQWASLLGMRDLSQDLMYKKLPLGFTGLIEKKQLFQKLKQLFPHTFDEGKQSLLQSISKDILKIGVSAGAFSSSTLESLLCSSSKPDLLLTGEVALGTYNASMDAGIPLIPLGHYYTEFFGVLALKAQIEKDYPSLNSNFIGDEKFI